MYRSAPDGRTCAGFLQAVRNAFEWLDSRAASTSDLPAPSSSPGAIDAWLMFSRDKVGKWKGLLKRAVPADAHPGVS